MLSHPYNILNATGINYLRFPINGSDGKFVFQVRVIDEAYSYCDLTATFALDVYGAPLATSTISLVVGLVTLSILLFLLGSYYNFRNKQLAKASLVKKDE